MANEITISPSANCRNGIINLPWQPGALQVDQAAAKADFQSPTVDSAAEAQMDFGQVTSPGFLGCSVANDETNFVEIGILVGGTFHPVFEVSKDCPLMGRPASGAALYQKADTADVKMAQTTYAK